MSKVRTVRACGYVCACVNAVDISSSETYPKELIETQDGKQNEEVCRDSALRSSAFLRSE